MNRNIICITIIFILLISCYQATADETVSMTGVETTSSPNKLELKLVSIFDALKPEYIFVINGVGFKSIDSLKEFLENQPKGTELTWAPSCRRSGDEPLLSSEAQMNDFKLFLEEKGIIFKLIPSG